MAIPIILVFTYLFNKNKVKATGVSLVSTFIVYLLMRFGMAHMAFSTTADAPPIVHATLIQRLLTIPFELFSYIRLVFFPKDLFVSQQFIIKSITDPRFYISLPIVLAVAILFIAPAFKLKSKLYVFFLIWIILFFSMIVNIFPLDFSLTERWLYGPLIGILGIVGVLILQIPEKFKKVQTSIFIILVLTVPILIVRTVIRNRDWKDNMTIISHDLKLNPDSYELQGDYGTLLGMAGDSKGAKEHIEKSLELSPTWWTMHVNLGVIYEKELNFEKAKEEYLLVISKTNDLETYEKLAVLKYKTEDARNAVDFATTGLKYYPGSPTLNFVVALSYYKLGDKISALTYAQKTYYLHPSIQTSTAIQRISGGLSVDGLLK
jgi:tetratricopeptide (TPR) repeat protein